MTTRWSRSQSFEYFDNSRIMPQSAVENDPAAVDLEMKKRQDHAPTERDPMLKNKDVDAKAPKDIGGAVYAIILLNGLGALLPWNMFITIAPQYYVEYWFTPNGTETDQGRNFMSTLGIASQLPNLGVNLINTFVALGGTLFLRCMLPLGVNCVNITIVIVLTFLVQPSIGAMGWFYTVTLILVAVLNASNGLYQNSIFGIPFDFPISIGHGFLSPYFSLVRYGLTADFPPQYTNAIVLGNNICGIFTTVLNMVCTLFIDDIRTIALTYFFISLVMLLACGASLVYGHERPFFKHYVEAGERARKLLNFERPGIMQYIACFRICWVQLFNVFFTFFVTLTIFPAMLSATPPLREAGDEWSSLIPESIYVTVSTFLNFNLFAAIGSFTAGFAQFPSERFLWIPVTLRVVFVPFFMFCNYRPSDRALDVYITSEYVFMLAGSLLAFTHGYFSSLAMMYAPRVVNPSMAKVAGMSASLCLILGLFSGVSFTLFIAAITTDFKA